MHGLRDYLWLISLILFMASGSSANIVFFESMKIHFDTSSNNVKAYKFDGSDNQVLVPSWNVAFSTSRNSDITLHPDTMINGVKVTKALLKKMSEDQESFKKNVRRYQLFALAKALKAEPNIINRHLLLLVSTASRKDLSVENFLELWSVFDRSWMVGSYLLPHLSLQGDEAIQVILSMVDTLENAKAFLSLLESDSERRKAMDLIKTKFELTSDDAIFSRNGEKEINTESGELDESLCSAPTNVDSSTLEVEPAPIMSANADLLEDFSLMGGDPCRLKILQSYDLSQLSAQDLVTILQGLGGDSGRKDALKLVLSSLSDSAKNLIHKNVASIVATFKSDNSRYDALESLDLSQLVLEDMKAIMGNYDHDHSRFKALTLMLSKTAMAKEDINSDVASLLASFKGKAAKLDALELFDISEISPEKIAQIVEDCSGDYDRKSVLEKMVKSLSPAAKTKLRLERKNIINKFSTDQNRLDVINLINPRN